MCVCVCVCVCVFVCVCVCVCVHGCVYLVFHFCYVSLYLLLLFSTMEVKDKIHYMETWWCQGHDALVSCNIHRSLIGKMVEQSNTTLRLVNIYCAACTYFLQF